VKLPKLGAGSWAVKLVYAGSSSFAEAKKELAVTV